MVKYYLAAVVLLLLATPVLAAEDHALLVTDVLNEIITAQDVTRVQDIDCDQVTDQQFERLGDAVMEQMHPGQ